MSKPNEESSVNPDPENDGCLQDQLGQGSCSDNGCDAPNSKSRFRMQNLWRQKTTVERDSNSPADENEQIEKPDPDEVGNEEVAKFSGWFQSLWKSSQNEISDSAETENEPSIEVQKSKVRQHISSLFHRGSHQHDEPDDSFQGALEREEQSSSVDVSRNRSKLATAFANAISSVTDPKDKRDVVDWFVAAYDVLETEPQRTRKVARLYELIDSRRVGKLIVNTARRACNNYKGSNLPLSIKLALPVTTLGACMFGTQGAGVAAFGGGIGLPVVLLLFLGSAGVASIIEALTRDKRNIEPTTRLLLSLIELESARRIKKDLAEELKADLETPRRCDIHGDNIAILAELRNMDPFDFERHVMSFFEACGYPSAVTRKSKDNGFDGWVDYPPGILLVQCKRNAETNHVGRPEIQQFKGVIEEQQAFHGYFVTSGTFSKDAIESAELTEKVTPIDCEKLLTWHRQNKADLSDLPVAESK